METPFKFQADLCQCQISGNTPLDKIVTDTARISIGPNNPIHSFSVYLDLRPEPLNEYAFIKRFASCRRVVVETYDDTIFGFDPIFTYNNQTCFSFKGTMTFSDKQFQHNEGRGYYLHDYLKFYGKTDTGDRLELFAQPGESIEFDFKFFTKR